jgi:hypothetical protein
MVVLRACRPRADRAALVVHGEKSGRERRDLCAEAARAVALPLDRLARAGVRAAHARAHRPTKGEVKRLLLVVRDCELALGNRRSVKGAAMRSCQQNKGESHFTAVGHNFFLQNGRRGVGRHVAG